MCGICGLVSLDGAPTGARSRSAVDAMLASVRHRGPDDLGVADDGQAIFGNARLAIRGLADGRQPIVDAETGVMSVCNGEIDNHAELRSWLARRGHRVRQDTDVAVLPGMYLELGDAFVERLAGAFALAVWDPRHRTLVLARDRAGERPLLFSQADGVFAFASEVSALLWSREAQPELDADGLRHFLRFGHFPSDRTPFRGLHRVGPAEVLTVNRSGITRRRYWRWSPTSGSRTAASSEAFDRIFRDAVRRQSEVDVEHGIFLSGGLDSSLVAAVARSLRPERPLKGFTLRFDEASYDEGTAASRVADSLGLQSVTVHVRPDAIRDTLLDLMAHCGEPLADPAWVPTMLLARRAAEDVRVVLGGEGADELFGGYPTYPGALAADRYARLPRPLRLLIRRAAEAWPVSDKKVTVSFLLKRFVQAAELDPMARHLIWTSAISPTLLSRLGLPPAGGEAPHDERHAPTDTILDRIQRHDLETSLAEGLLTKADRACMRWGLESRAPFIDIAVMNFAAGLPPEARVDGLSTKVFLKQFALRYLPRDVVHRRKRGLSVPLAAWLRGPLFAWAEASLTSPLLAKAGIEPGAAAALLREHAARKADHARALWTLIVLSEWLAWEGRHRPEPAAAWSQPPAWIGNRP